MRELADAIGFITETKARNHAADKAQIQQLYAERFRPRRSRSLFLGQGYSMRFSEAQRASFSNTVLSLSALREVDGQPMVVCVVGSGGVRFLLANSTFLARISHSSKQLRIDNVKGSFNGTDILTSYQGVANRPENFEQLFAMHTAFTWAENLERLVEATTAIVPRNVRFDPTPEQQAIILAAPDRAAAALASPRFAQVEAELRAIVRQRETDILRLATVENINLRGNRIERLVTGGANQHELGDLRRAFDAGELVVDIKTKLSGHFSAPKAYNIDKLLALLAEEGSTFAFLIIGVDLRTETVIARLVPVLDEVLLAATAFQHHWSGRGSRGHTQLCGRFDGVLADGYTPTINIANARAFLRGLLTR